MDKIKQGFPDLQICFKKYTIYTDYYWSFYIFLHCFKTQFLSNLSIQLLNQPTNSDWFYSHNTIHWPYLCEYEWFSIKLFHNDLIVYLSSDCIWLNVVYIFIFDSIITGPSSMAQRVTNLSVMQETQGMWVWSLGWEDVLEEEMVRIVYSLYPL